MFLQIAACFTVIGLLYGLVSNLQQNRRLAASLPPGPPGHWLFGNVPPKNLYAPVNPIAHTKADRGLASPFIRFAELTEIYGPVFTLRFGRRIVCVVGRHQVGDNWSHWV